MGPPFPIKSNTKSHQFKIKSYSKEKNGERHTGAAAWEEQNNPRTEYKSRTKPNTSEGVLIPTETGQTGSMDRSDRSDRCQGLVRPVGLQHPPVHDLIGRLRFFLRNEVFSAMPSS